MFTLSYSIDDTIEIGNDIYTMDLSFDNVLRFFDMLEDEDLEDVDKVFLGINMLLNVSFLFDFDTQYHIFNQLLENFVQIEKAEVKLDRLGNPLPVKKQKPNYSLKYDAEYIYASFYQAYGMDLLEQQGKLHWAKFKALLGGLPDNTKFRQVLEIRTRKMPTGKHCAEERKGLREMKRDYALPWTTFDEEGEG